MDQQQRALEVVRQTAELLSSGEVLSAVFERLCTMLAQYIDASVVFIALARDGDVFIEFAYDHGISRRDIHLAAQPHSQTRKVFQTGQPVYFESADEIAGPVIPLSFLGAHREDSSSGIFVPLVFGGRAIGVLSVQSDRRAAYERADVRLIETCALYVAVAANAEVLRSEKERLESVAARDPVTDIATRRVFDQRLMEDWARARRDGSTLSLLLLDIDWFKRFNDAYGHVAGDACLKQVAQTAGACLGRDSDLFARFGGEEFAGILWATDSHGAKAIAEQIVGAIRNLEIPHLESPIGRVTVCVGIASARAESASPEMLLRAADRALYAAKTSGRDRIVIDQLDDSSGTSRSRAATNNLRAAASTFIGRTEELAALSLRVNKARLLTVVGAGGIGKTRVAVVAAQRRLYAYLDGTWFFDYSAIEDPFLIDSLVASTLGISQSGRSNMREAIAQDLRNRNLLLIFDNCERLRADISELCETILSAASGVTILATSRTPLLTRTEEIFELGPLDETDALELFYERARTAAPHLTFQPVEQYAARKICRELDCLPLAIELAAAHVKTLSTREIEASLQDRFLVLEPSDCIDGASAGLAASIRWAYDLLDVRAKRLFENFSVFSSAVEADAVRDICCDDTVEAWDVAGVFAELIERNLVRVLNYGAQERFGLHESTRALARERLEARDAERCVERRHMRYYRALARRAAERLDREAIEASLALAPSELDNLRLALQNALLNRVDIVAGADIVLALARFWVESGRLREARYWVERALNVTSEQSTRVDLLYAATLIAQNQGDFAHLAELGSELVSIHERTGNGPALAKALNALGNATFKIGDNEEAIALYEGALEQYRIAGDRRGIAIALMNLGSVLADRQRDYDGARMLLLESLDIFRELGVAINAGMVLANLGEIAGFQGDYEQALRYASESLTIFERLGNKSLATWQTLDMARYRLESDQLDGVAKALRDAGRYLSEQPSTAHLATFAETAFCYACDKRAYELAARIHGFLERFLREHHQPRTPVMRESYERRLDKLAKAFDPATLTRLTHEGELMQLAALHDKVEAAID